MATPIKKETTWPDIDWETPDFGQLPDFGDFPTMEWPDEPDEKNGPAQGP